MRIRHSAGASSDAHHVCNKEQARTHKDRSDSLSDAVSGRREPFDSHSHCQDRHRAAAKAEL
jgi:hypothetical protein